MHCALTFITLDSALNNLGIHVSLTQHCIVHNSLNTFVVAFSNKEFKTIDNDELHAFTLGGKKELAFSAHFSYQEKESTIWGHFHDNVFVQIAF